MKDILLLLLKTDPDGDADTLALTMIEGCSLLASTGTGSFAIVGPNDMNCRFVVTAHGTRLERRSSRPVGSIEASMRRADGFIARQMRANAATPFRDT